MRKKYTKEEMARWEAEQIEKKKELAQRITEMAEKLHYNPEELGEYFRFQSRFHNYSANNTMLIYMQNPLARFCGSYQKYKEMGYSVKRGEKGLKIFVPTPVTLFRTSENGEWNKVSEATKAEKEKIKNHEYETRRIAYFKVGTVFEIAQTNCPLEDYPKILQEVGYSSEQHEQLFNAISKYASEELSCPVDIDDLKSTTVKGYFTPSGNYIKISDRLQSTEKLSVLTHELGHAILHNEIETGKSTAQEEVEADAFSIMLQEHCGIDLTDVRNHHLAASFRKFATEQAQLEAEPKTTIGDIIDNVNALYNEHIDMIQRYIDKELNTLNYEQEQENPDNLQPPYVHVLWSEHPALSDNSYFNIKDAQNLFAALDFSVAEERQQKNIGYYKTKFQICFPDGTTYGGRQDFGDGDGGVIDHIKKFWENEKAFFPDQTVLTPEQETELQDMIYSLWNAYDNDYVQAYGKKAEQYKAAGEFQKVAETNDKIMQHLNNIRLRQIEFQATGIALQYPNDITMNKAVENTADSAVEIEN